MEKATATKIFKNVLYLWILCTLGQRK